LVSFRYEVLTATCTDNVSDAIDMVVGLSRQNEEMNDELVWYEKAIKPFASLKVMPGRVEHAVVTTYENGREVAKAMRKLARKAKRAAK
jgi:hypothetical protein